MYGLCHVLFTLLFKYIQHFFFLLLFFFLAGSNFQTIRQELCSCSSKVRYHLATCPSSIKSVHRIFYKNNSINCRKITNISNLIITKTKMRLKKIHNTLVTLLEVNPDLLPTQISNSIVFMRVYCESLTSHNVNTIIIISPENPHIGEDGRGQQ